LYRTARRRATPGGAAAFAPDVRPGRSRRRLPRPRARPAAWHAVRVIRPV